MAHEEHGEERKKDKIEVQGQERLPTKNTEESEEEL